ncbi:MAG TPA: SPOR domain-containing protein, partial [Gammaproteobacteria bacterium]|nr:SPOR domain-containing protein [Gammaproteobacteria bacterium]
VQAVATSFDTLDAKVEAQQPRMEAIESVGKSNRIGLFVLFFLGLLGALALWWSNMGRVAEIEQRITQELTSPDQRYITREYLADKLQALESVLTGNSERIEKVAAALPSQNLVEHQTELEQHLARLEAKLNPGTTGTADSGASNDAPDKPLPPEVQRIQLELERINTALAQLSKQSAAGTGDAGLSVLEDRLSKTAEQLGTRLSQLEAERLDAGSSRIAAIERAAKETSEQLGARIDQLNSQQESIARIERNLSDTGKALGARLDKLETDSADTGEMLRQLQNQLLASGVSRKTSVQAATASEKSDPAIWQAAADTGRYAIQLAGSRNKSALIAFTSGYSLPADTAYFRTVYAGRDWYILLLGPYSSFSNASNVLENLPSALNRYDPWIRKIPADAELIAR